MMNRSQIIKALVVCTLLLGGCIGLQAQGLRHSVCVVYPEISPEDSTFLSDYALTIARNGKTAEARRITAYLNGSFGSGVLTEHYVLTNQHVVGFARKVKLVFYLHDETLTFPHCEVVMLSDKHDLAAVALPDSIGELVPLVISSVAAEEGENISAAGYPGLQNKPSWQLTRGYVSNASLSLEDAADKGIQHTAPVDPGSSGGPLLRKVDGKYEVLGLNTFKAFHRDRVCIAVPASEIHAFLAARDTSGFDQLRNMRAQAEELKEKERQERNSVGLEDSPRDKWAFYVAEEYFFRDKSSPEEHLPSFNIEYSGRYYMFYGMTLGFPVVAGNAGFSGGLKAGGQIPVRLNENNYLIPRVSLGMQIGTMFSKKNILCYLPVRAGLEYRYQFKKSSLLLGVEYVFRPGIDSSMSATFVLRHGLGFRAGVVL